MPGKKQNVKEEPGQQPWKEGMGERRDTTRMSKVERNVEDLTEMMAEVLGRLPEKDAAEKPARTIIFETPEGRAALEEEGESASSARRSAYSSRKALKDLYDVTTASYEAEGDVWSDLFLMHADFVRRRSRWAAVEKRMRHGKGALATVLKALPWITALVVGSLLVYGVVDQPPTFQFVWTQIQNDVRLQLALAATVVVVLGSVVWWLVRGKKSGPKE